MANSRPANNSLLNVSKWALQYAFRRPSLFTAVTAGILLRIGIDLLKPWPMVFLIDYVLRGQPMPGSLARAVEWLPGSTAPQVLVGWSVLATFLIFLLGWLVGLFVTYSQISLGQRMTYDLAGDLFARLQQLSLLFHARKSVGDNIRRVTSDCSSASTIVKDALLPLFSSVISVIAMFSILWQIDRGLTLLSLAIVPVMVWVFRCYAGPMMQLSYQQQEAEGRTYGIIEQSLTALPVVQAFGRERWNDQRFAQANNAALAATLDLTDVQLRFKIWMGLATAAGTAGIIWLGALRAWDGAVSVGSIIAFLSYLGALYAPLSLIMYTGSTLQGAAGSARRVREVLDTEILIRDNPGAAPLASTQGRVRFENVAFGYEPGRPVLKAISFDVAPGETIALVGATGAGKSTLVALLPRFFDPWEGRVLVDDKDIRQLRLKDLRRHISMVLQDPFLFPISIAENIAYGSPHASFRDIEAAARAANAHEFITRLPQGYECIVGERGATLSGGERQRISIARALLRNAPILILDEPTSALDSDTERSLMEALERLTRGRTTFIIAHRLSTVHRANRILALSEGRIVETGTHAELLRLGGAYARYHQLQTGA